MKKLLPILLLVVMPVAVMAQDWKGLTNDWDALSNWTSNPDPGPPYVKTTRISIDPGDVAANGGTFMPLIDDTVNTQWGWARIRNGAVITQTGGSHQFINGTGDTSVTFYMYNSTAAQYTHLDLSGGTHIVNGRLHLGYNGVNAAGAGTTAINISGAGTLQVLKSPFDNVNLYDMRINTNSLITIADSGKLIVNTPLQSKVDSLISSGRIVGVGNLLTTATVGDTYVVSLVPEPATLALVGLGALLVRRRRP